MQKDEFNHTLDGGDTSNESSRDSMEERLIGILVDVRWTSETGAGSSACLWSCSGSVLIIPGALYVAHGTGRTEGSMDRGDPLHPFEGP